MRTKEPYYEINLNRSIGDSVNCVSKGIDAIEVGIFDPVTQSVKYLPNAQEATIYISSGNASNMAIIDFSGTKNTNVKLFYNSNVVVKSNKLSSIIEQCKLP